jgi:trans-2-enoyl-CoA reductase
MWLMAARVSAAFVPTAKTFGQRAMISLQASESEAVTAVQASDNDFDNFSSKVRKKGVRSL